MGFGATSLVQDEITSLKWVAKGDIPRDVSEFKLKVHFTAGQMQMVEHNIYI